MKNDFDINSDANKFIVDEFDLDDGAYVLGTAILNGGYAVYEDFDPNDVKRTFIVHPMLFDGLRAECSFPFVPSGKINAERLEAWYGFKDDNDDRLVYVFDYPRYNMGDKLLAVIRQPSGMVEDWDSEEQNYYSYDCGSALVVAWIERHE